MKKLWIIINELKVRKQTMRANQEPLICMLKRLDKSSETMEQRRVLEKCLCQQWWQRK